MLPKVARRSLLHTIQITPNLVKVMVYANLAPIVKLMYSNAATCALLELNPAMQAVLWPLHTHLLYIL